MTEKISIPMTDPGDYITKAQCETLELNAGSLRDKIIIAMLWRVALRESEVAALKRKDFILEDKVINVRSLKRGKNRKVIEQIPLMPEIIPELRIYLDKFPADAWIFPSWSKSGHISRVWVYKILRKACDKSGITHAKNSKRIHPHTLRHSAAIHLIKKKIEVSKIQAFLRHTSLASTTYYLRFDYDTMAGDIIRGLESD